MYTARADVDPFNNVIRFVMEAGDKAELALSIPVIGEIIKKAEAKHGVLLSEPSEIKTKNPFAVYVIAKFYSAADAVSFAKDLKEFCEKLSNE